MPDGWSFFRKVWVVRHGSGLDQKSKPASGLAHIYRGISPPYMATTRDLAPNGFKRFSLGVGRSKKDLIKAIFAYQNQLLQ
jgi:hypothetical protein